ncbi:MAG: PTS sugar transporter subunit IIA [Zetaproteobacteria bacterium]|nr:MAG: PTS sugar transporter subunit IIA [Zetaproteobacteria bacterium]
MNDGVSLIPADAVLLDSRASSKSAMIAEIVGLLPSIDPDQAMAVVMEREKLGSTGIGHGIAIPHGRLPDLDAPVTALARHIGGVDFEAIDGQPVHIVVVLLAPANEDRSHLEMLAGLARTLQQESVRQAIMQADTAEAVSALFPASASQPA